MPAVASRRGVSVLVSFVIAAYNAEATIERCVCSCTGQSESELEVIVVDDGSTDGTARVVETMAGADGRIRLVQQANAGVSAARNTGIEAAKGVYVCFADADDFVSPWFVEAMWRTVEEDGGWPGIVFFRFAQSHAPAYTFERPTGVAARVSFEEMLPLCLNPFAQDELLRAKPGSSWAKAYSRSLLDESGARFPVGVRFNEDVVFNLSLLLHANAAGVRSFPFVDTVMYCYVNNADSATHAYRPGALAECEKSAVAYWDAARGCLGQRADWDERIYSRLFSNIEALYAQNIVLDKESGYSDKRERFFALCRFHPVSLSVSEWCPEKMGAMVRMLHWCASHGMFLPAFLYSYPYNALRCAKGALRRIEARLKARAVMAK